MSFVELKEEVARGLRGENQGIPTGHNRLKNQISVRRNQYVLISGQTGSAKTTYMDNMFVLNPIDWYLKYRDKTQFKLKMIYRSMERHKKVKLARWISRKIFVDHKKILSVGRLLGWWGKLTHDEHDLFLSYEDYINEVCEIVEIISGPENKIGVAKHMKERLLGWGRLESISDVERVYVPDDPNLIVQCLHDHISLTKTTKEHNTPKAAIDAMSDEYKYFRDTYGISVIVAQQYNRNLGDAGRLKGDDPAPRLEDLEYTSRTSHDADLVLGLFDPLRYKIGKVDGYDATLMRDEHGRKRFRSLHILKNSYGPDDVSTGLAMHPDTGIILELPKSKDMTSDICKEVCEDTYFLKNLII